MLAICGTLVRGMHITSLIAAGLGSEGVSVDRGC